MLDTPCGITYPETSDSKGFRQKRRRDRIQKRFVLISGFGEPCLRNLNFKIASGETFAIIGATGTGKTTLVNLIPRFYDVTDGEILINGRNIKSYPEKELEKLVAVAPQKATLFSGDIKSNITYGCDEDISDSDERITRALDVSRSDFVAELEQGIHAPVAQGGTNFSGGQKQRLSIARAVFKDSGIMIFDDTFSALDYKTDMLVRKKLREQLSETTVIIVAQRIGTIRNADKILVLHDGVAAGLGTHDELLKTARYTRKSHFLSYLRKNLAERRVNDMPPMHGRMMAAGQHPEKADLGAIKKILIYCKRYLPALIAAIIFAIGGSVAT